MSGYKEHPFPGEMVDVRMTGKLKSTAVEEDCHTWQIVSDNWTAKLEWNGYGRKPVTRRMPKKAGASKFEIVFWPLVILGAIALFCYAVELRGEPRALSLDERIEDCATEAVATALFKARVRGQSATPENGGGAMFQDRRPASQGFGAMLATGAASV